MPNPNPQVDPNNPQPTPANPNPGPARTPTPTEVPLPAVPPGVSPLPPDQVPASPEPLGVPPTAPPEVPGTRAATGAPAMSRLPAHYCLFDTAIGTCGIAWNERGLTRVQLPEADRTRTERRLRAVAAGPAAEPPPAIKQAITDIRRYLAGERVDFSSVAIDLMNADAFARDVYAAARLVGWGRTTSYGELAREIGAPAAARDVGQALSRNPVPIVVPCHRILAKGRAVGGFSAPGGTRTKLRLLALEGVRIGDDAPRLPGL